MESRNKNPIVADGQRRIRNSEEYRLAEIKIRTAVASKYQTQLKTATLFQWVIVHFKMRREVNQELQKIAPSHGSYLKT